MIPQTWRLEFEDWADSTLQSLSEDVLVNSDIRAYARCELAYRRAAGVRYVLNPDSGAIQVIDLGEPNAEARVAEIEAAEKRVHDRVVMALARRAR